MKGHVVSVVVEAGSIVLRWVDVTSKINGFLYPRIVYSRSPSSKMHACPYGSNTAKYEPETISTMTQDEIEYFTKPYKIYDLFVPKYILTKKAI